MPKLNSHIPRQRLGILPISSINPGTANLDCLLQLHLTETNYSSATSGNNVTRRSRSTYVCQHHFTRRQMIPLNDTIKLQLKPYVILSMYVNRTGQTILSMLRPP